MRTLIFLCSVLCLIVNAAASVIAESNSKDETTLTPNKSKGPTASRQLASSSASKGVYFKRTRALPLRTISDDELDKMISSRCPEGKCVPESARSLIRDLQNTIWKRDNVVANKDRIISLKDKNISEIVQIISNKDRDILNMSKIHSDKIIDLKDKIVNMTQQNGNLRGGLSNALMKLANEREKRINERKKRMSLQAIIDANEMSERILSNFFPEWAGYRPPKNFEHKYWMNAFLNKENSKVVKMTAFLNSRGFSQKKFVDTISKLCIIRDESVYNKLYRTDRFQAYEYLKNTSVIKTEGQTVLDAMLLYLDIDKFSNDTLEAAADQEIEMSREGYKLMRMMHIAGGTDEETLKKGFDIVAEKLECNKKAIAFMFVPHNMYILFDTFETALCYWNKRKHIDITVDERASLRITHVENEVHPYKKSYIKITLKFGTGSPTNLDTVMEMIHELEKNNKITHKSLGYKAKRDEIIWTSTRFEYTLKIYQLCKNAFPSSSNVVVSIKNDTVPTVTPYPPSVV